MDKQQSTTVTHDNIGCDWDSLLSHPKQRNVPRRSKRKVQIILKVNLFTWGLQLVNCPPPCDNRMWSPHNCDSAQPSISTHIKACWERSIQYLTLSNAQDWSIQCGAGCMDILFVFMVASSIPARYCVTVECKKCNRVTKRDTTAWCTVVLKSLYCV